ncbi:MAG: UDP-glucosyltransferase [Deltaproteobacteria bacterium]|nr:UDP-glucosyltransferase [Deltaproteobacteria bacterium]
MRRILFYAVNGLGLGHVTRLLAIARKVRRLEPETEILFVTSSEADGVIYREGFAAIKVPSKTIRKTAGLSHGTYVQTVQSVVWSAVAAFRPDTIVVDTFPTGSLQELLPLLSWNARKVFVYREQREEAAKSALFQSSLKLYDVVIVPHDRGEAAPILPEGLCPTFVGPVLIRDRAEILPRQDARARLQLSASSVAAYATFGGGGDPEIERVFGIVDEIATTASTVDVRYSVGPLERQRRTAGAAKPIADLFPAMETFAAFDFAIASAGYNTVHEILHAGVPAVFIPFRRGLDDQELRAERVAAAGAGIALCDPSRESLAEAWSRIADPRARAQIADAALSFVPRNGAENAARAIIEL